MHISSWICLVANKGFYYTWMLEGLQYRDMEIQDKVCSWRLSFTFLVPITITLGSNALACWEGLTGSWQQVLSLGTAWNGQVIKIWSECSGKWRFQWASGGLNSVLNKWLELADKAEITKLMSLQPLPLSAVLFQFSKAKIAQLLRLYLLESTQMALTASPWISSLRESLTAWLAITERYGPF